MRTLAGNLYLVTLVVIGVPGMLSYITGVPEWFRRWTGETPMSFSTALAVSMISFAGVVQCAYRWRIEEKPGTAGRK